MYVYAHVRVCAVVKEKKSDLPSPERPSRVPNAAKLCCREERYAARGNSAIRHDSPRKRIHFWAEFYLLSNHGEAGAEVVEGQPVHVSVVDDHIARGGLEKTHHGGAKSGFATPRAPHN